MAVRRGQRERDHEHKGLGKWFSYEEHAERQCQRRINRERVDHNTNRRLNPRTTDIHHNTEAGKYDHSSNFRSNNLKSLHSARPDVLHNLCRGLHSLCESYTRTCPDRTAESKEGSAIASHIQVVAALGCNSRPSLPMLLKASIISLHSFVVQFPDLINTDAVSMISEALHNNTTTVIWTWPHVWTA